MAGGEPKPAGSLAGDHQGLMRLGRGHSGANPLEDGRPGLRPFPGGPGGRGEGGRHTRSSCGSPAGPADGGVRPALGSAAPARPAARRWLNQARPSPARGGAASGAGQSSVPATAGSLATASIIPSRWRSHGVMDITHDSPRQSRDSLGTRGPLCTKRVPSPVPGASGAIAPLSPTDTEPVSYYRLLFQPEGRETRGAGWEGRGRKQ